MALNTFKHIVNYFQLITKKTTKENNIYNKERTKSKWTTVARFYYKNIIIITLSKCLYKTHVSSGYTRQLHLQSIFIHFSSTAYKLQPGNYFFFTIMDIIKKSFVNAWWIRYYNNIERTQSALLISIQSPSI